MDYKPPKDSKELKARFQEIVEESRQLQKEYHRQHSMEYLIEQSMKKLRREVTDDLPLSSECNCSCHPQEYRP